MKNNTNKAIEALENTNRFLEKVTGKKGLDAAVYIHGNQKVIEALRETPEICLQKSDENCNQSSLPSKDCNQTPEQKEALEALDQILLTICHTTVMDNDGAYDVHQGRITAEQYRKIRKYIESQKNPH